MSVKTGFQTDITQLNPSFRRQLWLPLTQSLFSSCGESPSHCDPSNSTVPFWEPYSDSGALSKSSWLCQNMLRKHVLETLHTLKRSAENREEKTPCFNEAASPCCAGLKQFLQRGRIYSQLEVWFKHRGFSDWGVSKKLVSTFHLRTLNSMEGHFD